MTSKFPLYSTVINLVSPEKEGLSLEKQIQLAQKIKSFDKTTHELVYALIKAFQINNPETSLHTVPYEGKQLKTGLKFNISSFPDYLQNILDKFVELHEKRDSM